MPFNEADTIAKLIDPALHRRGWTEDLIRREETAGRSRSSAARRGAARGARLTMFSGSRSTWRRSRSPWRSLKRSGRTCRRDTDSTIVLDEGLLFRTNEEAFAKTKRKLLDECDLWCVVSLPAGVFTTAGAGVKTNLLVFTKGQPTRKIWYYDLSDI